MHDARLLIAALAALPLLAGAGQAQKPFDGAPQLASEIYVERISAGGATRELVPAAALSRGDRVVTLLRWQAPPSLRATGFTLTNALPAHLAWQDSANRDVEVSVDGGRTWGHLGALGIEGRLAVPEDVTHVRWHVSPQAAKQGAGRIAYSGLVR